MIEVEADDFFEKSEITNKTSSFVPEFVFPPTYLQYK
jgi:hypothetical protein